MAGRSINKSTTVKGPNVKRRPVAPVTREPATPTLAKQASEAVSSPERLAGHPEQLLAVQQVAGNRAARRLIDVSRTGPNRAQSPSGLQRQGEGEKAKAPDVTKKAKSLREKLSYGLFDWAVTDAEAREVIVELSKAGEAEFGALVNAIGEKYINRLLNNLAGPDRASHGKTIARLIRHKSQANLRKYIKELLSYGVFDWAVTSTEVTQVVEALRLLSKEELAGVIGSIPDKHWRRLLSNGDKAQLAPILEELLRIRNLLDPRSLIADERVIGPAQVTRAIAKYKALESNDKDTFRKLLEQATVLKEQRYLYKALAAGHDMVAISAFAAKIRGKGDAWLQNNLHLTEDTKGKGIKQQWSHTCNITTVQAVMGEMDPIFSMRLHEENPDLGTVDEADATKINPKLAAMQKGGLESKYTGTKFGEHAGVAAPRANIPAGGGRWADDKLNAISGVTGIKYTTRLVGPDISLGTALSAINSGVESGMPVPIVIGNGPKQYTHYVLVTRKIEGKPVKYMIHDPWAGETYTRSYKELKEGKLNIAGSNQITAIEDPSAAP
jgi:hypothetical protein